MVGENLGRSVIGRPMSLGRMMTFHSGLARAWLGMPLQWHPVIGSQTQSSVPPRLLSLQPGELNALVAGMKFWAVARLDALKPNRDRPAPKMQTSRFLIAFFP